MNNDYDNYSRHDYETFSRTDYENYSVWDDFKFSLATLYLLGLPIWFLTLIALAIFF